MYLLLNFNIDIYSYSILKSDKKDAAGNLRKCITLSMSLDQN